MGVCFNHTARYANRPLSSANLAGGKPQRKRKVKITVLVDGPTEDTGIKVESSPHAATDVKLTIGGSMTTVNAREIIDAIQRAARGGKA